MSLLSYYPLPFGGRLRRNPVAVCVVTLSVASFLFCAAALPVLSQSHAHSHRKSELAYIHAQQVLQRLEAKPPSERTRMDYERALNAYRAVYHGDPASPDAARSIASTAYLLASAGRCFHQKKLLHDAIQQWEFLRREYPTNSLRKLALFEEAQIEEFDLHDATAAKKTYRSFLTHYPNDPLAVDARAALDGHPVSEEEARKHEPQTVQPQTVHAKAEAQTRTPQIHEPKVQKPQAEAANPKTRTEPQARAARTREPRQMTEQAMETPPVAGKSAQKNLVQQTEAVSVGQVPSLPSATRSAKSSPKATIEKIRYWAEGDSTRIAVDMSSSVPYRTYSSESGRQITLVFFGARSGATLVNPAATTAHDANLDSIHINMLSNHRMAMVLTLKHPTGVRSSVMLNPSRLILDLKPESSADAARNEVHPASRTAATIQTAKKPAAAEIPVGAAAATNTRNVVDAVDRTPSSSISLSAPTTTADSSESGQQSMTRVLGLRVRRIVIDAGHGGHDSGTIGPDGLEEKDVALGVALRLGHLLRQRLGAQVIYTRRGDTYVPLEKRTAIANNAHADLFLSIHANSSSDPKVRGVETYFLNFTSSRDAMAVAARENADSDRSEHELSTLVRKIALSDKIGESRLFAEDVQQKLYQEMAAANPGLKNRGVKQAPFVVLIGAQMPSILTEISFLTNSQASMELRQPAYRERVAEALYRGVAEYVQGMSGVRVAKTMAAEALPAQADE